MNEVTLNAFFYVIVPAMLVSVIYMITHLPETARHRMYRMSVIGLLGAVLIIQYQMWSDITTIASNVDTLASKVEIVGSEIQRIPSHVTETQISSTEARFREELRAIKSIFGL